MQAKKRTVFVSGTFNIVHPGHLRLLRFAAECGERLIVGVLSDRLSKNAHISQAERLEGVSAIGWVSQALVLEESPEAFIKKNQPDIVVKGKEHELDHNPEEALVRAYGGKLLFSSGDTTFSSIDLIQKETRSVNHRAIGHAYDFLERHQLNLGALGRMVNRFSELTLCVIGDTIIDEYIQCDPLGMSAEDPTIVVTPIVSEKFIGGAAIVAAHARRLGASAVHFISVVGQDTMGGYAQEKLQEYRIHAQLIEDDSRPTTLKQRYRASNKTLLRVSHLRQNHIAQDHQHQILEKIKEIISGVDLLIFSDFNYGVLPPGLIESISELCQERQIPMVADSQCSSQVGDVSRFKNMALLTPTEREARIALSNQEDGLVVLAEKLREKTRAENIVITLGSEGLLIHAAQEKAGQWLTDRLPALNSAPKDPAGAGDCFLTCSAMAMALGATIWESAYLGALAAACQVGRVGNIPLTAQELNIEISKNSPISDKELLCEPYY